MNHKTWKTPLKDVLNDCESCNLLAKLNIVATDLSAVLKDCAS